MFVNKDNANAALLLRQLKWLASWKEVSVKAKQAQSIESKKRLCQVSVVGYVGKTVGQILCYLKFL